MQHFRQEVDTTDEEALRGYLRGHFRYHTMNSWNQSTSYAHCVKVEHLPLTYDQKTAAYEMLDVLEVHEGIRLMISDWESSYDYEWQVGFNGRSGGYLVLYQGGRDPDRKRTFCYSGRSLDQDEDFTDWDLGDLQARAEIVNSFDQLCDDILTYFIGIVDNYAVKEEIVMIPKTVKVLEVR